MYKCIDCGFEFEEPKVWNEDRGEHFGAPCSEDMDGCPRCNGDYEETVTCGICDCEFFEGDLHGGVCDDCIDEYRYDFETCRNISIGEDSEIKLSSIYTALFRQDEIEAILREYIKENNPNLDCSAFIDENKEWFGEMLAREVKK